MKNIPLLVGTIVGTLILIIAIAFMFSGDSQLSGSGQVIEDQSVLIGEARNVKMVEDFSLEELVETKPSTETEKSGTTYNGNLENQDINEENLEENDPNEEIITIVEFSDFQCPACANAAPFAKSVTEAFPGQVRLIYRHFPLDSIHPNARNAAIAAEAVASINKDKFWDMHDLLFENQNEWSSAKSKIELNDIFVTYVDQLDIDRNEFIERIEDNSVIDLVRQDSNTAIQLGINSTPTFYVNGVKVSAPQLFTVVESLVSKE